jgi:methylglyoxal synthase
MKALLRVAVVWNITIACNRATADYLVSSPLIYEDYTSKIIDYSARFP